MQRKAWRSVTGSAVVLLVAAVVAAGCGQFGKTDADVAGTTAATSTTTDDARITSVAFDKSAADAAGCDSDEASQRPDYGRTHAPDENTKITYKESPPTSGEHWNTNPFKVPRPWGVYDSPQPDSAIVHNLEHGEIVVDYKGISDAEVQQLVDARTKDPRYITIEPRTDDPEDGVYYLSWRRSLHCDKPTDAALQYMVTEFRDQGPEPIQSDPAKDSDEEQDT